MREPADTDLYFERLERRAERERAARRLAEGLLEEKSLELYNANQQLKALAANLERRVEERTRDLREANEKVVALAERDQLTGVANRQRFITSLAEFVTACGAANSKFALFLVDLDRFKSINDSLGHEAGDVLLQHAAQALMRSVRQNDVVARLGGDEFAVICRLPESEDFPQRLAARILASVQEPFEHLGRPLSTSCSIGAAVFPSDATTVSELQRYADMALYRSKAKGRAAFTLFDRRMGVEAAERLALERRLRRALADGEIKPWFQPVVSSRSNRVSGFEVLARWEHPEKGLLLPGQFIELVEENGLMETMFEAVFSQAMKAARPWVKRGKIRSISINVSPSQFRRGTLASQVPSMARDHGFPAEALVLEITEALLLYNLADTRAQLEKLSKHGIRIALDDFGSGYSNISYLRRLPLHFIKLDRSLTVDVVDDPQARCIVSAIAEIARSLDLLVVAEGIENAAQGQLLSGYGCNLLQGYHFGRPMPASEVPSILARTRNARVG